MCGMAVTAQSEEALCKGLRPKAMHRHRCVALKVGLQRVHRLCGVESVVHLPIKQGEDRPGDALQEGRELGELNESVTYGSAGSR